MNIYAVLLRELQLTITMSTAWHFNIHLGLHTSFASPSVYLTLKPKTKPDNRIFSIFFFQPEMSAHHFPAFHSHARDSSSSHFSLPIFPFPFLSSSHFFFFLFHYTNHTPLHSLKHFARDKLKARQSRAKLVLIKFHIFFY